MLRKKQKLAATALIISVIVFSIVVFFIPFKKETTFWVAYISEIIALLSQVPIFWIAYHSANDLRSRVLSFPITQVGFIYLAIQSAASIVLFILGAAIDDFPVWITVITCILIIAAAIVCCITVEIARDTVMDIETQTIVDTKFMTEMRLKSASLVNRTQISSLKKEIEKLSEAFKYSDPVSSEATASKEEELRLMVSVLEDAVKMNDSEKISNLCNEITRNLEERNNICKLYKNR